MPSSKQQQEEAAAACVFWVLTQQNSLTSQLWLCAQAAHRCGFDQLGCRTDGGESSVLLTSCPLPGAPLPSPRSLHLHPRPAFRWRSSRHSFSLLQISLLADGSGQPWGPHEARGLQVDSPANESSALGGAAGTICHQPPPWHPRPGAPPSLSSRAPVLLALAQEVPSPPPGSAAQPMC